jgi:hypothetical protein
MDEGFEQVNQEAIRSQDFLILSTGPDGFFGRALPGDKNAPESCKADDIGNFSLSK